MQTYISRNMTRSQTHQTMLSGYAVGSNKQIQLFKPHTGQSREYIIEVLYIIQ